MHLSRIRGAAVLFTVLLAPLSAADVDIVVTATKEPAAADQLPVAVVVLDGADLKGKTAVVEALESTLAVRLDTQVPGQPVLTAPGFGENGFGRISFLVDGFAQGSTEMAAPPLNLVPIFALDRIELLRAPDAVFYGNGSVAGAVNLVTKIPRKFEALAAASLDNTLTNRQSLAAGFPLGSGGLLVSVVRDQELPSRDRSDSDLYQAWSKISLPFVLAGLDQDFSAWASFSRTQYQLPGSLLTPAYEEDPTQATNLNDHGIRTESKAWASWSAVGSGWTAAFPASATVRSGPVTYTSQFSFAESDYRSLSLAPQFSVGLGSWAGADVEWSGGGELALSQLVVDRFSSDDFKDRTLTATVDRATGALWSRLQASWSDKVLVSTALRSEIARTEAASTESEPVNGSKSFTPWAGQLGLTWLPTEGVKLGVEASKVYRYPFTDEMISYYGDSGYGNYDYFNSKLQPETGYGSSASASWKSGAWQTSTSATLLSMDQELLFDAATGRNVNAGKTWHLSSLAQTAYSFESWSVGVEYTFETARFANGADKGNELPLVPAHRGRLWGKAAWDIGTADAGWNVTSGFYKGGDNANALSQVSWSQSLEAGATVFLGSPQTTLRVYGKNLTGDRTPTSVYYSSFSGNTGWYPVEGRTFGATLAWQL